jgi:hypothetical protein
MSTIPASTTTAAPRTPPIIPPICDVVKVVLTSGTLSVAVEEGSETRSAAVEEGSILVVVHELTMDPRVIIMVSVTTFSLSVRRQGASAAVAHIYPFGQQSPIDSLLGGCPPVSLSRYCVSTNLPLIARMNGIRGVRYIPGQNLKLLKLLSNMVLRSCRHSLEGR